MADFQPTTTIWLFKNTKVSLQNQPYFTSEASKIAWYTSHSVKTYDNYSYQREPRQYVRVRGNADELRQYDMLAYRNAPGLRAIFCRIIDVGFINPNVTEITFETDAMQTFIDVLSFEESWVEREMVENDWNGGVPSFNNLMPEGIERGREQKKLLTETFGELLEDGGRIIVLSAYDGTGEPNYDVQKVGAFAYGLNRIICSSVEDLNALLRAYENKGILDGIVGIWCVPALFSGRDTNYFRKNITVNTSIDGYTPKNAKCFTSEFMSIELSNRAGTSSFLAPEFLFDGSLTATLEVDGNFAAGAGGMCMRPLKYNGETTNMTDYGVYLPLDCQTCYVGNAFANWVGQNKTGLIIEGLANAVTIGTSVAGIFTAGNGTNATASAVQVQGATGRLVNSVYSTISSMAGLADKSSHPAASYGQTNATGWGFATGNYGFSVYLNCPNVENLKSIDDFFTVYGYRTCRAKKPNVDTRPFWNYVKCAPATVSGPITSKDKQEIEAILNAGVTFWHVTKGAVIGDYSMDNRG